MGTHPENGPSTATIPLAEPDRLDDTGQAHWSGKQWDLSAPAAGPGHVAVLIHLLPQSEPDDDPGLTACELRELASAAMAAAHHLEHDRPS